LLPGDDVTLYDGKPWITIDGRVKLMRRHKDEYRGHAMRPLSADEKADWGWAKEDIVIETTVRTVTYGEIKGYGRVSAEEAQGVDVKGVRHNPVARNNPVEMAMKRSLARAERFAFGTDALVDDEELEETARVVIEERNNPEFVARNAQRYNEIFSDDDDGPPRAQVLTTPEPSSQGAAAESLPDPPPALVDKYKRNRELIARAREMGLAGVDPLALGQAEDVVEAANLELADRIARVEWEQEETTRQKAREGLR
jgi:hypothetical protein